MMLTRLRFLNTILVGLLTGIQFGIWFIYGPTDFSYSTFVELHQGLVGGLNTFMPVLGLITILSTLASGILQRRDRTTLTLLMIAAVCLIGSGLITKFGNQVINAHVMGWTVSNETANWTGLRHKWISFHIMRSIASFIAMLLITWTAVRDNHTATAP